MKKVYYIMANYGAFGWKEAGGPYSTVEMAREMAELLDLETKIMSWYE